MSQLASVTQIGKALPRRTERVLVEDLKELDEIVAHLPTRETEFDCSIYTVQAIDHIEGTQSVKLTLAYRYDDKWSPLDTRTAVVGLRSFVTRL